MIRREFEKYCDKKCSVDDQILSRCNGDCKECLMEFMKTHTYSKQAVDRVVDEFNFCDKCRFALTDNCPSSITARNKYCPADKLKHSLKELEKEVDKDEPNAYDDNGNSIKYDAKS